MDALLVSNKKNVFFLSKDGCKYCAMLEKDLSDMEIPFEKYVLGSNLTQTIVNEVKQKYAHNTYPMLFFGDEFIGGYSDFQQLCYTGQLETYLKPFDIKISMF